MFKLPDLPYAHDALEPTISAATVRLHHGKHHARCVAVVNEFVQGGSDWTLEAVILGAAAKGERKLAVNAGQSTVLDRSVHRESARRRECERLALHHADPECERRPHRPRAGSRQ